MYQSRLTSLLFTLIQHTGKFLSSLPLRGMLESLPYYPLRLRGMLESLPYYPLPLRGMLESLPPLFSTLRGVL